MISSTYIAQAEEFRRVLEWIADSGINGKHYQSHSSIVSLAKKTLDEASKYIRTDNMDVCPICNRKSVRAKGFSEGGGVECTNPECEYWFCF
jgi:hypothetical protein